MTKMSTLIGKIAGVDEVGRGPLAGPVVAAAVILDPNRPIDGLMDSKKLTEKKREGLHDEIIAHSLAYAIGRVDVAEIDALNIHHASLLAMQLAIEGLPILPDQVLVDGCYCPPCAVPIQAIIKGDQTEPSISAASIIAKVIRDREMVEYAQQYPGYSFEAHKGYGTKKHLAAMEELGITPIHRKSYAPVKALL